MIHKMIDSVVTGKDFVKFLYELEQDLLAHPDEWENPTLDRFFEAMAAWVNAVEYHSKSKDDAEPLEASWKTFAEILYAGKIYE